MSRYPRLPWLLLVVSLAFNVAFAAGFIRAQYGGGGEPRPPSGDQALPDDADPTMQLVTRLELDEGQREQFIEAYRASRQRSQDIQERLRQIREQSLELRKEEEPDIEQLRALRGEARELFHTLLEERETQFSKFMQSLSPEQRRAAVEMMRGAHQRRRALTPEQREAWRQRFEQRRQRGEDARSRGPQQSPRPHPGWRQRRGTDDGPSPDESDGDQPAGPDQEQGPAAPPPQ